MKKYSKKITIGYNADGNRIRKMIYGDTKYELEANIRKTLIEIEKLQNPTEMTFGQYKKQWFELYKSNRSVNTRQMYEYALKKTEPIDMVKVKSLTKSSCQQLIRKYEGRTAQILTQTINQIIKAAYEDGMIPKQFKLEVPKYKADEKHLLTDEEIEKIKSAHLNTQERFFVDMLFTFGLRPGEALALRRSDFDQDKNIIKIDKALAFGKNESALKDTKNHLTRELPIPSSFKPIMEAYFGSNSNFYIFTKQDNGLMTRSAYRRFSERIIKKIGIDGFTFYMLRHYRATQLYYQCQKGSISTKLASKLMGHSEEMFLHIYSHIDSKKEDLKDVFSDAI